MRTAGGTARRKPLRSRPRSAFWRFERFPRWGNTALLAVVAVGLIADAAIRPTYETTTLSKLLGVGMLLAMALFAWRPPVAAIALIVGGGLAVGNGLGGAFPLALAIATGLVVYTCSLWLSVTYCTGMVLLSLIAEWSQQGIASGGSLGTFAIALGSALIGLASRRSRAREQRLAADLDAMTREATHAVKVERDRIADELHNIIAHDITIVMMQVRALNLIEDSAERDTSIQAIEDAAAQAMTDIRRMLRVVQEHDATSPGPPPTDSILPRLATISEELRAAGIRVELDVPDALSVSPSIDATLCHLVNEGTTNVLKHAPGSSTVHVSLKTAMPPEVSLRMWNSHDPHCGRVSEGDAGYGLKRMTERVALLGGTLTFGPDDGGWSITATLPRS